MLTELPNQELEDRVADLEKMTTDCAWVWGMPQQAQDGKWWWRMGCAQVSAT
jgi:hypothetical protein